MIININGIRRSGTHAVANWIMSHFSTGFYINDITSYSRKFIKLQSDTLPSHKNICKKTNIKDNPNIIIIGIENEIDDIDLINNTLDNYSKLSNINNIKNIILIRNYFNLAASHIKAWPNKNYHFGLADHWKKYINLAQKNQYDLVVYDNWLDHDYRNNLAKTLGFVNKDLGLEEITKYGGGSSFGDTYPSAEKLKNRWKHMINNKQYIDVVKNFKYWEDYINIFGQDDIYEHFSIT
jgi:hypothetical protein